MRLTHADREWSTAATAVSGKIHNCYSANDKVLKYLYQAATAMVDRPIGAYPIQSRTPRITNWNFSDIVAEHTAWKGCLSDVLQRISATGNNRPRVETPRRRQVRRQGLQ